LSRVSWDSHPSKGRIAMRPYTRADVIAAFLIVVPWTHIPLGTRIAAPTFVVSASHIGVFGEGLGATRCGASNAP
jgi:hypothetical protein